MTGELDVTASGRATALVVRPSTLAFAALVAASLAVWPAAQSLGRYWNAILDYEHGWLIAATSIGWLAWRRARLDGEAIQPSLWGSAALLGALLVWLLAYRGSNEMAYQLLVPAVLWLAVLGVAGWPLARHAAAPLAYLYFSIPVWDYLLPYLQRMTVAMSELGLSLMGIQAHVLGDQVTIPEGTFEIAEGCSGKRYLLVALALAGLVGIVNRLSPRRLLGLFAAATGLALLANWIRVIVVIYAGHISAMHHYLVTVEHQTFGLEVFVVLILVIGLLGRWWAPAPSRTQPPERRTSMRWQPAGVPLYTPFIVTAAFVLLMSVLPSVSARGPVRLGGVPVLADRWSGPLPAGPGWHPYFPGANDAVRVAYASSSGTVEVYANVYGEQVRGSKPDYYENSILTPGDWQAVGRPGIGSLLLASLRARPLILTARSTSGELWVIAYAYAVAGHVTGNALAAQLYYGALTVAGPTGSGVIGVAARCRDGCDSARHLVADFWARYSSALAAAIPTHPGVEQPDNGR